VGVRSISRSRIGKPEVSVLETLSSTTHTQPNLISASQGSHKGRVGGVLYSILPAEPAQHRAAVAAEASRCRKVSEATDALHASSFSAGRALALAMA
jgi:hypothetical protein